MEQAVWLWNEIRATHKQYQFTSSEYLYLPTINSLHHVHSNLFLFFVSSLFDHYLAIHDPLCTYMYLLGVEPKELTIIRAGAKLPVA